MTRQASQPGSGQLTDIQRRAAGLLADGATDERVAVELGVPLPWVQSLEESLPVAAAIVRQQHRRYQAHRARIRSLLETALDVVEEEMAERPSVELAVALLRILKAEAPGSPLQTPVQLLEIECQSLAREQIQAATDPDGWRPAIDLSGKTAELMREQAHRLNPPPDPAELMP